MLRRHLLRLDPDAVRRRHARAVADRAVAHFEFTVTNTAAVSGSNLPVAKAAAAYHHLDDIARATKAAGDPRTLDQIRADVFTDLLAGIDPTLAGTATTPAARKATIHLHLDLPTLAMLDDEPGEIAGFGPVLADIARQTAAQLADTATWRFTITDHGIPAAEGRLNRRHRRPRRHHHPAGHRTRRAPGHRPHRLPPHRRPGPLRQSPRPHLPSPRLHPPRTALRHRPHQRLVVQPRHHHRQPRLPLRRHHRAKHIGLHKLRRGAHGTDWTTPRQHRYTVIPHNTAPPSRVERTVLDLAHGHPTPSKLRR